MALKKLTLSVDEEVVERARVYSERHGTSISQMVGRFLAELPLDDDGISPRVRQLMGTISGDVKLEDYKAYLEEKYGA